MGSLLSTLSNVADSMGAINKALQVTGNNVTNAGTPGYVRQRLDMVARPMDVHSGLAGGVSAGNLISSRQSYLEQSVRQESTRQGRHSQETFTLEQIEPIFNIAQASGVAGALDSLFRTFSQWSVSPNDLPIRESVLRGAQSLAASFNFTASALGNVSHNAEVELRSVTGAINRIGSRLQEYNVQLRGDARRLQDPSLDAQIHSALEELSEYTDFSLLRGDDGSFNVYVGGQTPLVIGDKLYQLGGDFSAAGVTITDFRGNDISGQFQQGRIRALLDLRNDFVPSLLTDLDRLAVSVADRINGQLSGGVDLNGEAPTTDLFAYDASAGGTAASLRVNNLTPDQLAAARPEAPGGNGNALALAALGTSQEIDDFSFTQYFGQIASRVGRALSSARDNEETHSLLLSQARTLRSQVSEVSLDEEAANLISFQRAYDAAAQLVRVLNDLTQTTIDILR